MEDERKMKAVTKLLYESERRNDAAGKDETMKSLKRTSELLAKVQSFLPKIAKANEAMRDVAASRGKESVDIEQLVSETEPYVEMNLAVAPSEVAGRVEKALSKAAAADAEGDGSVDGGDSEAEEEAPETFEDPAKKKKLIEEL